MGRIIAGFAVALVLGSAQCWAQQKPDVIGYFKNYIGLGNDEIADIRGGQAVVKTLRSRTPDEIFVFGAVYINAAPDAYIGLASDFDRLRKQPGNIAMAAFSSPARIADLNGFTFESADIESLKKCKPRNCDVQMPESSMKSINQLIDWSAPNAADQINQMLQQTAIKRLSAYRRKATGRWAFTTTRSIPRMLPDNSATFLVTRGRCRSMYRRCTTTCSAILGRGRLT